MSILFNDSEVWRARREEQEPWKGNPLNDEERDRARIIHSAAFRRLQAKTQVLGIGESDFHRTRLTHTMEVAQIGSVIALRLVREQKFAKYKAILPTEALIQAVCFAHDLGHPPFGHCGEIALNHAMRCHDGFEGNGQSLRIVGELEPHTPGFGLNLSRRVLLGILKYPAPYSKVKRTGDRSADQLPTKDWEPPKCYLETENDLVDFVLDRLSSNDRSLFSMLDPQPTEVTPGKTVHKSLDASIMDLADDIAYGIHDLEDGISLKLITREDFTRGVDTSLLDWARPYSVDPGKVIEWLFGDQARNWTRREAVGSLLNALTCSVEIQENTQFDCPLLRYRAKLNGDAREFLKAIKEGLIVEKIINSQEVQPLEFRGRKIVSDLFNALLSDPASLLGETPRKRLKEGAERHRVVCDFIAGMTDVYANRFHERLYGSRQASVFERL